MHIPLKNQGAVYEAASEWGILRSLEGSPLFTASIVRKALSRDCIRRVRGALSAAVDRDVAIVPRSV